MPSWIELALTLASCLGVSQLVAGKGERRRFFWAALVFWVLLNFAFLMLGVLAEMNGWFMR